MNKRELEATLEAHRLWTLGEGGKRASLRGADLGGAYLENANLVGATLVGATLRGAYLENADLRGATLRGATLRGANLVGADLENADLRGATLRGANLRGATLRGATLRGTCLDPAPHKAQRQFVRQCPPLRTGGRIVYRTATSRHVGSTEYVPGHTFVAPNLSFSAETACHPGIYAADLEWMRREYPSVRLVRCYVRDGDWVITAKGAIRCKRLRVLGYVEGESDASLGRIEGR